MQKELFSQEVEIDFEGKKVRPKNGVYRCPFNCGNPNYPQKKWKTLSGFKRHMKVCPQKPSAVKARMEAEEIRRVQQEAKDKEILEVFPYKIGDHVHYFSYHVTAPTHKQRGSRMVRVRYEEKRKYYSGELEISTLEVIHGLIRINSRIWAYDICESSEIAEKMAKDEQKRYDEACNFASMCR